MANSVTLLNASNNVIGTFATIQAAVNAASNGDTVQIAAGTYQEQVTVNGLTNLTIEGAGQGQTIILSPDYTDLVSNIQNPGEFHTSTDALVGVENGASVTVKNLTVDGNNQGVIYAVGANGGGDLVGIEGVNSSLNVSNVHVTGTEDVEGGVLQGGQGNKGVIVNDTNSSTQTFTMTGSTVDNFQKAGILMEGTGLNVNVSNNVVTGVGGNPTNISQNLIEIEHGATGSITHNFVTGVSDGAGGSTGILIFQSGSGVTVSNNTVLGLAGNVNSAGIYFAGVDAPVAEGNSIANQGFAIADDGSFGAFTTALLQDNNIYIGDAQNYYFFAGPTSTNAWTVTGTGGPDDLEGGAKNDVFTVTGVAPNGNIFVGNAGLDTVEGYGAGYHVAIQNNHWVVTNGTVTDTLTGIERVVINGQTHNLRARDDFLGNAVSDILFRNDSSGDTWFEAVSNGAFAGWNQISGSDTSYKAAGVGDFYEHRHLRRPVPQQQHGRHLVRRHKQRRLCGLEPDRRLRHQLFRCGGRRLLQQRYRRHPVPQQFDRRYLVRGDEQWCLRGLVPGRRLRYPLCRGWRGRLLWQRHRRHSLPQQLDRRHLV
jgi:hypothetical protein